MGRGRWTMGLALGAVLVIGGCGDSGGGVDMDSSPGGEWSTGGCGAARTAGQVTVGGLQAVISRIERDGKAEFASSFAGVEIDQEQARAIVYRVPSTAFDDFIRKAAEDSCVVVRDARHSTKDLAGWHDRVLADLPYWTDRGLRIVSFGARHDGSGVEVGVRDVEEARSAMLARYGPGAPLIFVLADPVRPLPAPTSRIAPPPAQ